MRNFLFFFHTFAKKLAPKKFLCFATKKKFYFCSLCCFCFVALLSSEQKRRRRRTERSKDDRKKKKRERLRAFERRLARFGVLCSHKKTTQEE